MNKCVFFDLDGTLTDPELGIINSVIYALERFSVKVESRESLKCFIGPPLVDSFMEHYGFSPADAEKALYIYREYFAEKGLFENEVYDGVPQMLEALKNEGITLCLATSKPEEYAERILRHFDLYKYFDLLAGATMDEKRNRKDDVIAYALTLTNCKKQDIIMVGDRRYDIEGAHKNGIKAVGVLYGYGDEKEMKTAQADYTVTTVNELKELLLGL